VAGRRRQPAPVRVSVAAAQNEDNRGTPNLARQLVARVRARREADDREGQAPMVNPPGSRKTKRRLRRSKVKGNRSEERKKARGLHRQSHNNFTHFHV
jgi:hypothetical protein